MIRETYFLIKLVGPDGQKVRGCKSYNVHDPEGCTSISSEEFETLTIPKDGITFYVMNNVGDTIDSYPTKKGKR